MPAQAASGSTGGCRSSARSATAAPSDWGRALARDRVPSYLGRSAAAAPSGAEGGGRMNATRSLTFLWTPGSLIVSSLIVLVTAGLGWAAWRRSGFRRSQGLLELLRLALVVLGGPAVQPAGMDRGVPAGGEADDRRAVGRLAQHGHAGRAGGRCGGGPAGRAARGRLRRWPTPATWSTLEERLQVVVQSFSGGPRRPRQRSARAAGRGRRASSTTCAASCSPRMATGTTACRPSRPRPACG